MGGRQAKEVGGVHDSLQVQYIHSTTKANHASSCFLLRYIPAVEESVIGVVTEKYGENFAVDIGGPFTASLPVLAFEGATRRNHPNLQVRMLLSISQHRLPVCIDGAHAVIYCHLTCTSTTRPYCSTATQILHGPTHLQRLITVLDCLLIIKRNG